MRARLCLIAFCVSVEAIIISAQITSATARAHPHKVAPGRERRGGEQRLHPYYEQHPQRKQHPHDQRNPHDQQHAHNEEEHSHGDKQDPETQNDSNTQQQDVETDQSFDGGRQENEHENLQQPQPANFYIQGNSREHAVTSYDETHQDMLDPRVISTEDQGSTNSDHFVNGIRDNLTGDFNTETSARGEADVLMVVAYVVPSVIVSVAVIACVVCCTWKRCDKTRNMPSRKERKLPPSREEVRKSVELQRAPMPPPRPDVDGDVEYYEQVEYTDDGYLCPRNVAYANPGDMRGGQPIYEELTPTPPVTDTAAAEPYYHILEAHEQQPAATGRQEAPQPELRPTTNNL